MKYSEKLVRELYSFHASDKVSMVGEEGQGPVYSQVHSGRVELSETGKDLQVSGLDCLSDLPVTHGQFRVDREWSIVNVEKLVIDVFTWTVL